MTHGTSGLDPLSDHFTLDAFTSRVLQHGDMTTRAFLTDHGNFTRVTGPLADQVLQHAQVAPDRLVASLSDPEQHRLHRALRDVLGHVLEGHHGYDS
jgi:formamidopyrimidine-DNA glycosylase